ncbi:uncharacterized protein DS421_20g697160 [Arachis hypogaea]|nr:uncharacterized protein DS421_20g697160 [Arachis hypogaea]
MGKKKLVETRCSPCYINNLFTHLERHNKQGKLAEIEAIGFDFLRRVPQWHVKQSIMLQLARAYNMETNTLRVDAGDIRITAELIGNVFGIPSQVVNCFVSRRGPNSRTVEKNESHLAIKREFQKKTTTQLRDFVFACPMETEQQRMTFRMYFIMVVLKMFLNPTSQQTISPWHLPPILDVSNPRRFHWPYHILKWLRDVIRKFQDENRETCGGCLFVLLVLYFHRLKHGPLDACRVPESWIMEWTTNELDKKADHVISQSTMQGTGKKKKKQSSSEAVNERGRCKRTRKDTDQSPSTQGATTPHPSYKKAKKFFPSICCPILNTHGCLVNNAMKEKKHKKQSSSKAVNEKAGCKRPFKDTDQSPSIQGKTTSQPSYKEADKESKTGTRRKLPVCKSRSRHGTKKAVARENLAGSNAALLVVPDYDDDDDVSLVRRIRLFQQQPPPHDLKQADPVFKGNHNSHQEANTDLKKGSPQTPPAALCPEFEQVLNSVEQGCETNAIIMHPLQTVLPNKSSYHTPSPGRPSFSLSLTQFEKTPTPSPLHSIHPTLKKIKLGENKEEQIRTWIVISSLDKDQDLAKYEGRDYMVLQRKDFWTLKPRSWVNSCVIQWMCYSLNDTDSSRFKRDFYCVCLGILESVT